jgi:transcriptional regulator with XRE-family HTH domain
MSIKMSNKISENLKKLRRKKGYSLEKVARLANLSLNTIVKIENGVNKNPTIETLTKIAKALEVGVDDLIK